MRPIYITTLDKVRPAVILTRETVRPRLRRLTVAPITTNVRGLGVEVPVGPANGIDHDSVINCDGITTVDSANIGDQVGYLLDSQEDALAAAITSAFDLDLD